LRKRKRKRKGIFEGEWLRKECHELGRYGMERWAMVQMRLWWRRIRVGGQRLYVDGEKRATTWPKMTILDGDIDSLDGKAEVFKLK